MTTRHHTVGPTAARPAAAPAARTAWLILAVLLLFSIAAPLNQFKVPPIMPLLMSAFKLSVGRAGTLMSVYALTGLILALPSGLIFQRAGYRLTGMIAGGSIVLGSALGALSTDAGSLLASRVIEGIGLSFMAVLAPAIIAGWFRTEQRGTAMGIWSSWVPVGTAIMLLVAPTLAQAAGWRSVWWLGAVYALAATALYLGLIRPAPDNSLDHAGAAAAGQAPAGEAAARPAAPAPSAGVLRNPHIWLLAAAFACFNMAVLAFGTYMPTYLATVRGLPLAQASLLASVSTLITIVSCPAGGILSDRIGSRKRPYLAGFVLTAVTLPLAGALGVAPLIALLVFMGLCMGLIPTNIFSAAVEAAAQASGGGDERQGGLAMAVIMVGQNAGALLGPVIFGALIESAGGWTLAFASLAVMSLAGLAAGWLARVR